MRAATEQAFERPPTNGQGRQRRGQFRPGAFRQGQRLLHVLQRLGHRVRTGACVCGRPVAEHYDPRSNRFISCTELAKWVGPAPQRVA